MRVTTHPVLKLTLTLLPLLVATISWADDKEETPKKKEVIRPSQTVELFRMTGNLGRFQKFGHLLSEQFPKFEESFLREVWVEIKDAKMPEHCSMGQALGIYYPDEESYAQVVLPIDAGAILQDEDYSLGEDEQGNAVVNGRPVTRKDHYYVLTPEMSESKSIELPPDKNNSFVKFVEDNEDRLGAIEVYPATISRSPLKKELVKHQIALNTAAQQQDEEADWEYAWRSLYAKSYPKITRASLNAIDRIAIQYNHDESALPFSFQLRMECRRKSQLLTFFQEMHKTRNRSLSWLHPAATSFATWRATLPDDFADQLKLAGRLTAREMVDNSISTAVATQLRQATEQLAHYGAAEILLQVVPLSEKTQAFVAVIPLGSASGLLQESVQLITGSDQVEVLADVDGWPIYEATEFMDLELPTCATVTDTALIVAATNEEENDVILPLLTELMRRDFYPSPRGNKFSRAFAAVQTSVTDIAAVCQQSTDVTETYAPKDTELGESGVLALDQDALQMTASLDDNAVVINFAFEKNAMAMGVTCAELIFTGLGAMDF